MQTAELKTGYCVLFHTADDLLDDGIEAAQDCKWQHAGIIVIENGIIYVVEMFGKCEKNLLSNYLNDNDKQILALIPTFYYNSYDLSKYALSLVGKVKYNYYLILVQLIRYSTNGKINLFPKYSLKLLCSNLVGKIYNYCNKKVFKNYLRISPKDLYLSPHFTHKILKY